MIILILAMACLFSSCHRSDLTCRSEYLYPGYLASCQMNTPDPGKACFLGQQVIVSWKIPKKYRHLPVSLCFNVRLGNREVQTITTPITSSCGWWTYRLMNQDYFCKNGILSFEAELLQQGACIAQWRHYLWARLIDIRADY